MKLEIIKKWYKLLNFPSIYDADFLAYTESVSLDGIENIDTYQGDERTPERNLLAYLYFCEELSQRYRERGIPEQILIDTMSDIVVWCGTYYGINGVAGLTEIRWIKRHLTLRLFKLGRLQFCMAESEFDIPELGIAVNDPVLEIHIPEGGAMTPEACSESILRADRFFAEYFPEFKWDAYTCHSWLLDPGLADILPPSSNILSFAKMFTVTQSDGSDAILKYVLRWDARRENVRDFEPKSSFARRVREVALAGGKFFESLGYIRRASR